MQNCSLSRGLKSIISQAISETNSYNRDELVDKVAQIFIDRYSKNESSNEDNQDKWLNYQLSRMGVETTKKLQNAIDLYFYKYIENI